MLCLNACHVRKGKTTMPRLKASRDVFTFFTLRFFNTQECSFNVKELEDFNASLIGLTEFRTSCLLRHSELYIFWGNNSVFNVVMNTMLSGVNHRILRCRASNKSLSAIKIYWLFIWFVKRVILFWQIRYNEMRDLASFVHINWR